MRSVAILTLIVVKFTVIAPEPETRALVTVLTGIVSVPSLVTELIDITNTVGTGCQVHHIKVTVRRLSSSPTLPLSSSIRNFNIVYSIILYLSSKPRSWALQSRRVRLLNF